MTYEWITRLSDLAFLVVGAFVGAWLYHRGQRQLPPLPQVTVPAFMTRAKAKKSPLDLPRTGA